MTEWILIDSVPDHPLNRKWMEYLCDKVIKIKLTGYLFNS